MSAFKTGIAKPGKIITNKKFPILNIKWIAKLQVVLQPIFPEHNYWFSIKTLGCLKKQTPYNSL